VYRSLRRHENVHTGNLSYCEQCNKGFTDPWILRRHILIHERRGRIKEDRAKYMCNQCGIYFFQKKELEKHLCEAGRVIRPKTKYQCSKCRVTYTMQSAIRKHKCSKRSPGELCRFTGAPEYILPVNLPKRTSPPSRDDSPMYSPDLILPEHSPAGFRYEAMESDLGYIPKIRTCENNKSTGCAPKNTGETFSTEAFSVEDQVLPVCCPGVIVPSVCSPGVLVSSVCSPKGLKDPKLFECEPDQQYPLHMSHDLETGRIFISTKNSRTKFAEETMEHLYNPENYYIPGYNYPLENHYWPEDHYSSGYEYSPNVYPQQSETPNVYPQQSETPNVYPQHIPNVYPQQSETPNVYPQHIPNATMPSYPGVIVSTGYINNISRSKEYENIDSTVNQPDMAESSLDFSLRKRKMITEAWGNKRQWRKSASDIGNNSSTERSNFEDLNNNTIFQESHQAIQNKSTSYMSSLNDSISSNKTFHYLEKLFEEPIERPSRFIQDETFVNGSFFSEEGTFSGRNIESPKCYFNL